MFDILFMLITCKSVFLQTCLQITENDYQLIITDKLVRNMI